MRLILIHRNFLFFDFSLCGQKQLQATISCWALRERLCSWFRPVWCCRSPVVRPSMSSEDWISIGGSVEFLWSLGSPISPNWSEKWLVNNWNSRKAQEYLTVIGSVWIPCGEGGGLFFKYFSLSNETILQFFSSLLSSQSWKKFKKRKWWKRRNYLNVVASAVHANALAIPAGELVRETGAQLDLHSRGLTQVARVVPGTPRVESDRQDVLLLHGEGEVRVVVML